jgi:hypothetical protein
MSVQLDHVENIFICRLVHLHIASGLVDNDRKHAGSPPEGMALLANTRVLRALAGAQHEDFPKILLTKKPTDQEVHGGGKMLDDGCHSPARDNQFCRIAL